jgi:hypothetical protein
LISARFDVDCLVCLIGNGPRLTVESTMIPRPAQVLRVSFRRLAVYRPLPFADVVLPFWLHELSLSQTIVVEPVRLLQAASHDSWVLSSQDDRSVASRSVGRQYTAMYSGSPQSGFRASLVIG